MLPRSQNYGLQFPSTSSVHPPSTLVKLELFAPTLGNELEPALQVDLQGDYAYRRINSALVPASLGMFWVASGPSVG